MSRGWEKLTPADAERMQRRGQKSTPKPSKYRNVQTVLPSGEKFQSKREADYWVLLKVRESVGEITDLKRQQSFYLLCPIPDRKSFISAAFYVADFTYVDCSDYRLHVVDAKGKRTALYRLKRKWLELQDGIIIEEV